jgi:hypothetical protein
MMNTLLVSFLGLAPGEYVVRVDAVGFKKFESSPQ